MTRILLYASFFLLVANSGTGQEIITNKETFQKQYNERIQQEVLNGVYIPVDLEDAINELERLTDADMIDKFRNAPEDTIATKLHFSLGRWIILNWGFYEGSRLSHKLKEAGLSFPDDMARLIIVSWHRKLNDRPLDVENQIRVFQEKRKQEAVEREKRKQVVKTGKTGEKN